GRGHRHALGKAADAREVRALAHASGLALRAPPAAVGRLARDRAADQPLAHAAADRPHDAGVLVAEHERRLVGKEALRGMDIGAADAGRLDGDDDLARACDGLGDLVEREAGAAVPGGDLHGCYLSSSVTKMQWRRRPSSALERWPLPEVSSTRMTSPAPILRDSPSLAVICTPASRLMMYWRRGAGCQSRSYSGWTSRKMIPVAGRRADSRPARLDSVRGPSMSSKCDSPFVST